MRRYIGCDVHARSCTFAIKNERGRRIGRDVVETNGQALVNYMRQIPGERYLCFEEGEQSQWLFELLRPHSEQVDVVMAPKKEGNKNDTIDAFDLADVPLKGLGWKRVYKDPQRFRRVREASRVYTMVTQDLVRVKSRVKSFYRGQGIAVSGEAPYRKSQRQALVGRAPAATQRALKLLYEELDALEGWKADAQRTLVQESHRHRIARVLETAPGLGEVRVAQMLPIVITPHRFRTKRQLWAYAGLGITTHSTSDWVQESGGWRRARVPQTRGLNRSHNHALKAIFKGAATTVSQHATSEPLHEVYEELLRKEIKPNLAKLTLARRIAAIVLAMWKSKTAYDPNKSRGQ